MAKPFDIAAAVAVTKKLTQPGPWKLHADRDGDDDRYRVVDCNGMFVAEFGRDPDNSAAVAAMRTLFPAALREIKRLRKELGRG